MWEMPVDTVLSEFNLIMFRLFLFFLCILLSLKVIAGTNETINVHVSILPQKFLVERIGGDRVDVTVMVKPGQSPETYDPTPKQIASLSRAHLYILIGVPFEENWKEIIASQKQSMLILNTCLCDGEYWHDPHSWTSPTEVIVMAQKIRDGLVQINPDDVLIYDKNYKTLVQELDKLDKEITEMLMQRRTDYFIVSHDSWGYYARQYGLKQLALESRGREKGPKGLIELVELARQEGIKTLFIQKQHPTGVAFTLAKELNAKAAVIDPLKEDYINNLRHVTSLIAEAIR